MSKNVQIGRFLDFGVFLIQSLLNSFESFNTRKLLKNCAKISIKTEKLLNLTFFAYFGSF